MNVAAQAATLATHHKTDLCMGLQLDETVNDLYARTLQIACPFYICGFIETRFKFDQGKYNGVTMHVIEADVPADEDEVRKIFGETLRVYIGTADKAVFLAVGDDSEAEMKRLIDSGAQDNGDKRPLAQLQFRLLPVLEYAQSVEENEVVAAMITALSTAADPGHVSVVSDSQPNGATSQLVLGEGLLKAIGSAVSALQQARMQGGQF